MNTAAAPHLLVVDDEPDLLTLYDLSLSKLGYQVQTRPDLAQARRALAEQRFALVLVDMRLPDGQGLELVRELTQAQRSERCIVITAYGSADNAVQALKAGAFDYLTKPVEPAQLRAAVTNALQALLAPCAGQAAGASGAAPAARGTGAGAAASAMDAAVASPALQHMVGRSAAMQALRGRIVRAAGSMAPVLVLGESGTGKELVARALHQCSHRCRGPFVAVNCAAIPETLLEAEFFGVRKGAYTGANANRDGYFQAARGGTLFLDEIGDLPLSLQVKLLRVLQERRVRALGASEDEATDVRLISATHRDLARAVQQGQFRQDLYYRLNVIDLHLPPLRQRLGDLPELAAALLQRLAERNQLPPARLSADALEHLARLPLPGNVRELENLLERALALHPGSELTAAAFAGSGPAQPRHTAPVAGLLPEPHRNDSADNPAFSHSDFELHRDAPSRAQLLALLEQQRWNQSRSARQLGWTLAKLRYWMQRHGLNDAP